MDRETTPGQNGPQGAITTDRNTAPNSYDNASYVDDHPSPKNASQRAKADATSTSSPKPYSPKDFPRLEGAAPWSNEVAQKTVEGRSNRHCLAISAVVFLVVFLAAAAIAVAIFFILRIENKSVKESNSFGGYVVLLENYSSDLADKQSPAYHNISSHMKEKLTTIFSQLEDTAKVNVTHISAGSIRVHYLVSFQQKYKEASVKQVLTDGLTDLVRRNLTPYRLAIPATVLRVVSAGISTPATTTTTTARTTPIWTISAALRPRTTPSPVDCEPQQNERCIRILGHTNTGYPSLFGIKGQNYADSALYSAITRIKSDCWSHAVEFLCAAFMPECRHGLLRFPCRSFCESFVGLCGFPIDCALFPDDDDHTMCRPIPQTGVITTEAPQERPKDNCDVNEFRCGNDRCVAKAKQCDSVDDCGDYSDEMHCGMAGSALDCDFENGDICSYVQNKDDDHFDWEVMKGATMSSRTGPSYDHTLGNSSGHYLLMDATGRYWHDTTRIHTVNFTLQVKHCLRFYYHLFGPDVESLKLLKKLNDSYETVVWQRRRDHGNQWKYGAVTLSPVDDTYNASLIFEATRGVGFRGDIAIDDITLRPGECLSENVCTEEEYRCYNRHCLPNKYVCNGENDCGDFSDEANCKCSEAEFQCGFGMCIDSYKRCDGVTDCPDSTDELNCLCPFGQHKCPRGRCIMAEWLCDRVKDCEDGSDEEGCSTCGTSEFTCLDYSCVSADKRCDGIADCKDSSDEHHCFRQNSDLVVEVMLKGDWTPVCAHEFPRSRADEVCTQMGFGHATIQSPVASTNKRFAVYSQKNSVTSVIGHFLSSTLCPSQQAMALECSLMQCGTPSVDVPSAYIVNGENSAMGRWPWHVGVFYHKAYVCGGTLISSHHVITAAHCLGPSKDDQPASNFFVRLGTVNKLRYDSDRPRVDIKVKKIEMHSQYLFFYLGYDVVILTLSEPVTYTEWIRPVCLPTREETLALTSLCYSTGWGYTNATTSKAPEILQEFRVKLRPQDECAKSFSSIGEHMICAAYKSGYMSNCKGDSGGPLMCEDPYGHWKLVGVFSYMHKDCNVPNKAAFYARVQQLLPWIESSLQCAFVCNNSKCILDERDLCNAVDDCGDFSDETEKCQPSISCDFEDAYSCGYTYVSDVSVNRWSRLTGSVRGRRSLTGPNRGPLVDATTGVDTGHFMYAGGGVRSLLVAPVYNRTTPHCLRLRYHMRGHAAGNLRVSWQPTQATGPPYALDANVTPTTAIAVAGDQSDVWHSVRADLPAGQLLIMFETSAYRGEYGTQLVAIDDVELLAGKCAEQKCDEDEFTCNQNNVCAPGSEKCNYRSYCSDGSDEDCTEHSDYLCDFETYGACGLQQSTMDDFDWRITNRKIAVGNCPTTDHTLKTKEGYMAYLDTRVHNPGTRAYMTLPIILSKSSCLQLHYNMQGNGSFAIYFQASSSNAYPYWKAEHRDTDRWKSVEVRMPAVIQYVHVIGTVGVDGNSTYNSYIAMDDLRITQNECTAPVCQPADFRCDDGKCVFAGLKCDGKRDCDDGSDERPENCPCVDDAFRCKNDICIQGKYRCNGVDNCGDNSDETDCTVCELYEYKCDNGKCKPLATWCDGHKDCEDGYDEKPECRCATGQASCDNGHCITGWRWCDGQVDCADGSDEFVNCTCDSRWHFRCATGQCIPIKNRCDMSNNCGDYSDEFDCACNASQFRCNDGMCIMKKDYCNGFPNCLHGEDEHEDCKCAAGGFKCKSGGCVYNEDGISPWCDDTVHCNDYSDENDCGDCYTFETRCPNGLCLDKKYLCDNYNDCGDFWDESNCTCQATEFRCAFGRCIDASLKCDGRDDCGDESDEMHCACRDTEHMCDDKKCIEKTWVCDGNIDCVGGTDENVVCDKCAQTQFTCDNYQCVTLSERCDGKPDCADGSDENNCVRLSSESDSYNLLEARKIDEWLYVCAFNWNRHWGDDLCKMLGNGQLANTSSALVNTSHYINVASSSIGQSFSLSHFSVGTMCPGNKVVKISCRHEACGLRAANAPRPYIIGGDLAAEGAWPWVAGIYYQGAFICGGVLVSTRHVLSAAHCFIIGRRSVASVPHYVEVRLGTTSSTDLTAGLRMRVARITSHADYQNVNSFRYNDIAVLELVESIEITSLVRPVCLPAKDVSFPHHSQCFTAGWGRSNWQTVRKVEHLREAKMTLWQAWKCSSPEAWKDNVNNVTQICAGYVSGNIATCFGDSGGPLMCQDSNERWQLAGITSGGHGTCVSERPAKPTIFTRVSHFIPWITQTMHPKSGST